MVQNVVIWHGRLRQSPYEIATEYEQSLSDVYAALAYYFDHRREIDAVMRGDEEFIAELRKRNPSVLQA